MNEVVEPELQYALEVMPPGRGGYRRWRWELWHGPRLLAAGWRMSERHAERALRTAASHVAHRLRGLHPLRPELVTPSGALAAGAAVRLDCGAVTCRLVPRELWLADQRAAAA